eukprot:136063_1
MACSDIMGCCGGKNEETEEINLLDLESGVVDVAKGDGTLDSEILGYEQSVENSLHVSSGHRNHLIIGVVALLAIAALIFAMYKYGFIYPTAYWKKRVGNMMAKLALPVHDETYEAYTKEMTGVDVLVHELRVSARDKSCIDIDDWEYALKEAANAKRLAYLKKHPLSG